MSAEIVHIDQAAAVAVPDDKIALLKRTIAAPEATDDELELFVAVCNRTGLDPFARQIHAVWRWDKKAGRKVMSIQTAIAGYRLVAQRTGQYAGQTMRQWCGPDAQWRDIWLSDQPPVAARVGVHRRGFAEPLVMTAQMRIYQADGPFWSMPKCIDQLAKCAEALALRAAFPQELSSLYTAEEMDQADDTPTSYSTASPPITPPIEPASDEDKAALQERAERIKALPGAKAALYELWSPTLPPMARLHAAQVGLARQFLDKIEARIANGEWSEEMPDEAPPTPGDGEQPWLDRIVALLDERYDSAEQMAPAIKAAGGPPLKGTEDEHRIITAYIEKEATA